jgi:DNA-binding NtrC family response regulator
MAPSEPLPRTDVNRSDDNHATPTEELVRPLVGRNMAEVERALVLQTLRACGGNRTHAAQILSVSVRTIHNMLRRWRSGPADGSGNA